MMIKFRLTSVLRLGVVPSGKTAALDLLKYKAVAVVGLMSAFITQAVREKDLRTIDFIIVV